jgi:hypothetical protein
MCKFCSTQLVIPDKGVLENGFLSVDEICSKYIHMRFPKHEYEEGYELHELKEIEQTIEANFSRFVKLHYFTTRNYEKDSCYKPYEVDYLDEMDEGNWATKSLDEKIIELGYKAHCNLHGLIRSYIFQVEQLKAKKRERRLKHKANIKEKKLQAKNDSSHCVPRDVK